MFYNLFFCHTAFYVWISDVTSVFQNLLFRNEMMSPLRKVIFCHKGTKTQRFHEVYNVDSKHLVILRALMEFLCFWLFGLSSNINYSASFSGFFFECLVDDFGPFVGEHVLTVQLEPILIWVVKTQTECLFQLFFWQKK